MPIPKELIYEGDFTIRTYEIDRAKFATVASLVNLMQEAAMQNVIDLKVSVWDMAEQHISWVLMNKNLKIFRLPMLGETIKVQTYPAGFDRLYTFRDYKVIDADNNIIAQSSSTWLLMDTVRRRVARIPENIRTLGTFDASNCLPRPKTQLPVIDKIGFQKDFFINWHDLDFNEHLSNIRYMQWMFETIDYYMEHKGRLQELDIIYKAECHWKDTVRVCTQKIDKTHYLHQLFRLSDNTEIAQAQTYWLPF